eukprot:TRINITY_DN38150_c0_g1_i1.p1 TRINITY_DN38150_c0_g1~~TRINITY_DN38150_c0_g1_i1.p1  ORF type:complete len:524 (-),score=71.34 TRINITY_DN38150_c0_g1_i1:408-1892(-)
MPAATSETAIASSAGVSGVGRRRSRRQSPRSRSPPLPAELWPSPPIAPPRTPSVGGGWPPSQPPLHAGWVSVGGHRRRESPQRPSTRRGPMPQAIDGELEGRSGNAANPGGAAPAASPPPASNRRRRSSGRGRPAPVLPPRDQGGDEVSRDRRAEASWWSMTEDDHSGGLYDVAAPTSPTEENEISLWHEQIPQPSPSLSAVPWRPATTTTVTVNVTATAIGACVANRSGAIAGSSASSPMLEDFDLWAQLWARYPMQGITEDVAIGAAGTVRGATEDLVMSMPVEKLTTAVSSSAEPCVICREVLCEGDEVKRLPCLHVFHRECIDQWLRVKPICPLDKFRVDDLIRAQRRLEDGYEFGLVLSGDSPPRARLPREARTQHRNHRRRRRRRRHDGGRRGRGRRREDGSRSPSVSHRQLGARSWSGSRSRSRRRDRSRSRRRSRSRSRARWGSCSRSRSRGRSMRVRRRWTAMPAARRPRRARSVRNAVIAWNDD